jgi:O-antigen/teichoic acid export membrane protein
MTEGAYRLERANPTETAAQPQGQSGLSALLQSVVVKVLIIFLNAATGILSARALRPSGRGELAAIILWNVLFANAFTFGVPSALTYQLKKRIDLRSEFAGAALLLSLLTSLLAMSIAVLGLPHWIPQYSATVIFFSRLFLLNVPLFAASLVGRAALESDGDFTTSNLSLLLTPLLTLMLLGGFCFAHHMTPVHAAWAYVVGGVPSCILILRRVHSRFHPTLRSLHVSTRLLLFYGLRSYGIDLCGTMSFYVDQVLVVHLLQSDIMGAYVVALSLSRMLNAFHTAAVMVLFPNLISKPTDVIHALTGRAVRITTFVTAAAGLFVALLGPRLVTFLYGSAYRSATGIVRILLLEVILSGIALLLSQAFMALGRPGTVTVFQISGLLLTIPLLILLVPRYGIHGAALAILFSTVIRLLAVMFSFRPLLHMPCPSILLTREDWALMSATVNSTWSNFRKSSPSPSESLGSDHREPIAAGRVLR